MEESFVYSLPDSYAKPTRGKETETSTNTWKLARLTETQAEELRDMIQQMDCLLDLSTCYGDALTRLGEMYGCARVTEDDARYRAEILAQILRAFGNASADTVLYAMAMACGVSVDSFTIQEKSVAIVQFEVKASALDQIPLSLVELYHILSDMLAAGVGVEKVVHVSGTFRYCAVGDEKSSAYDGMGFGEGYFGTLYNMKEEEENGRV